MPTIPTPSHVQRPASPASVRPAQPLTHKDPKGGLYGTEGIKVANASEIASSVPSDRDHRTNGSAPANKLLSTRSLKLGSRIGAMPLSAIVQMIRTNGLQPIVSTQTGGTNTKPTSAISGGSVQRLARQLLNGGRCPPIKRRSTGSSQPSNFRDGADDEELHGDVMTQYAALHSALAYLDEDSDEDDVVVLLTPVPDSPENLDDLARMLQQCEDPESLASLLQHVEGLPKDPQVLYDELRHIRYKPKQLVTYLREKQGLPADRSALRKMRQQIEDAVRALELSDGPRIHGALNVQPEALQARNPAKFSSTYVAIASGKTAVESLLALIELHGGTAEPNDLDYLRKNIESTIRALGYDQTSATPSRDPIQLHAIQSALSNMYLSNTASDLIVRLCEQLYRVGKATVAVTANSKRHETSAAAAA